MRSLGQVGHVQAGTDCVPISECRQATLDTLDLPAFAHCAPLPPAGATPEWSDDQAAVDGDSSSSLSLKVVNDGRGIADELRHGRPGHLGLVGMRERALAIGARLDVERVAEGGTCVALHWREEQSA